MPPSGDRRVAVGPVGARASLVGDERSMDEESPRDQSLPERDEVTLLEEDLLAISNFLFAPNEESNAESWPNARDAIEKMFPDKIWGTFQRPSLFLDESSKPNLYQRELRAKFRKWLEDKNIGEAEYIEHIPDVQFNTLDIWPRRLFDDSYRPDRGWRIQMLGFPAMQLLILGLAHAPQGNQRQDELGAASNLMRDAAIMVLANDSELRFLLDKYHAATSGDWNEGNLIPTTVKSIGSLDISGYEDGPRLKFIRNTSAKRQIASHFALIGMTRQDFESGSGVLHLCNFRDIAAKLGEVDSK
jgi:hypothetical protein